MIHANATKASTGYEFVGGSVVQSIPEYSTYNHFFEDAQGQSEEAEREVVINDKTAISYPPFWRAMNLISGAIGKLPCNLYARTSNDDREIQHSHRSHMLMSLEANEEIDANTFQETLTYHAMRRGNGYAYIARDGNRDAFDLTLLDPRTTKPMYAKVYDEVTGDTGVRLVYQVHVPGASEPLYFFPRDIFHLKGLSDDGIVGHDVLSIFKRELALGIVTSDHKLEFYKDGGVGGGVLMFKKGAAPDKQKETMRYWRSIRSGRRAGTRVAMLQDSTEFKDNELAARESQTAETREFQIAMASAITGVPQHKLGGKRITAYASIQEENKAFLDDALDVWICRLQIEAKRKLLSKEEIAAGLYFEYNTAKYERQSLKDMAETGRIMVNDGLAYADEWRRKMNLGPLPDGSGQRLRIPLNIGFVDSLGNSVQTATKPDQVNAIRDLVRSQFGNALNRMVNAAVGASVDPEKYQKFLASFETKHASHVRSMVADVNQLLEAFGYKPVSDLENRFFDRLPKTNERANEVALQIKNQWPSQLTHESMGA